MYAYTHMHIYICVCIYIYKYALSAIKKKKNVPFATMGMNLEDIMLSEIGQALKDKYHIMSLMWNLKNVYLIELTIERWLLGTRAVGWGLDMMLLKGYKISQKSVISLKDLYCNMMTVVNDNILCSRKLPRVDFMCTRHIK